MYNLAIAALATLLVSTFLPFSWLPTTIAIAGAAFQFVVGVCVILIFNALAFIKGEVFNRISSRMILDSTAMSFIVETFVVGVMQSINVFLFQVPVVTLFLGFGSLLTTKTLMQYLNREYESDFNEAMKCLQERKK